MTKVLDLTGIVFDRLTVRERDFTVKKRTHWICDCICGKSVSISMGHLRSGHTRSCGCLQAMATSNARKSHGMTKSTEFKIWMKIKGRCFNVNDARFHDYGGRGITMCEEWANSFKHFFDYVGPRPSKNHSIDRIKNNGNYEPGNVRWATKETQANNTRCNVIVEYQGQSKTVAEWARHLGFSHVSCLWRRLFEYKWSVEKAFNTPVQTRS